MVFKSVVCVQGDWGRIYEVESAPVLSVENGEPVISRRLGGSKGDDWRLKTVSRPQNRLALM